MEISVENKKIIIDAAKDSYPNECCGLLVNINNKTTAIPCQNISETPEKSFIINPEEIHKYNMDDIKGFYHSHKDYQEFSLGDMAFSEKLKKYCVLYVVDNDVIKIYEPNGFLIPYVGRPMFPGFLDCVSLCQDYYKRELNITFKGDIIHPLRYNHKSWTEEKEKIIKTYGKINVIEEYLINNNFIKVSNLQKNDILLFQMPNLWSPSHVAIFLNNNQILHHFYEFSAQENYSNAFKRVTNGIYRHINLI